jgi:hypothetical protein
MARKKVMDSPWFLLKGKKPTHERSELKEDIFKLQLVDQGQTNSHHSKNKVPQWWHFQKLKPLKYRD